MFHCVYQTTNLVNGKIYVGVHSTDDLNDGYLGSGKYLRRAITRYGISNFRKDILLVLKTIKSAYLWESIIVDNKFIQRKDTYNIVIGGHGGDILRGNVEKQKQKSKKISEIRKRSPIQKAPHHIEKDRQRLIKYNKETRSGQPSTIRGKQAIYSKQLDVVRYIDISEQIPDGFIKGSRPKSKEHKEKIAQALVGRVQTESTKEAVSKANKGRPSPFKGIPNRLRKAL